MHAIELDFNLRSTVETTDIVDNLALDVLQIPKARAIHVLGQHADGGGSASYGSPMFFTSLDCDKPPHAEMCFSPDENGANDRVGECYVEATSVTDRGAVLCCASGFGVTHG